MTLSMSVAAVLAGCGGGDSGGAATGASPAGSDAAAATTPKEVTVANPRVTGPVPATVPPGDRSRDYPQLATPVDLNRYGYIEQEFFFEGTATRYGTTPVLQTGTVISANNPYKSRMLVRRPTDAARFNGVVVVEWLNVTSGYNLDSLWQASSDFFMRSGYAYVGISAQRVGIHQANTGLLAWSPARYAGLDVTVGGTVTDDSLSYDVYAQGARAVQNPQGVDPLAGLPPARLLLASGSSQSEGRLVSYYNAVHPLHNLFDAYYLFLGIGGQVRTDQDVKAFKVNTENDVLLLGEGRARQPDSDRLRTWELAGASHVSFFGAQIRNPILVRDGLPPINPTCDRPVLSRVPTADIMNPAYDHLVRWVRNGTPPPVAERIRLTDLGRAAVPATPTSPAVPATPSVAARDEHGNALGGIRLAALAVPTATNTGFNTGPGFCNLYGSHEPFDAAKVRALYSSSEAYTTAVGRFTDFNLKAGYLLAPEADRTRQEAAAFNVGR